MTRSKAARSLGPLLLAVLACSVSAGEAHARPDAPAVQSSKKPAARKPGTTASLQVRPGLYYQRKWGVDLVGVRRVSSGMMLRFDYRVVNPDKASVLTVRKSRPYLIDEETGAALAVPALEKVGELRQIAPLETGRTYFIIFGNPGGLVKSGGRVSVVVGGFRAEGLVVK